MKIRTNESTIQVGERTKNARPRCGLRVLGWRQPTRVWHGTASVMSSGRASSPIGFAQRLGSAIEMRGQELPKKNDPGNIVPQQRDAETSDVTRALATFWVGHISMEFRPRVQFCHTYPDQIHPPTHQPTQKKRFENGPKSTKKRGPKTRAGFPAQPSVRLKWANSLA